MYSCGVTEGHHFCKVALRNHESCEKPRRLQIVMGGYTATRRSVYIYIYIYIFIYIYIYPYVSICMNMVSILQDRTGGNLKESYKSVKVSFLTLCMILLDFCLTNIHVFDLV